jgi:4-oxalocrotonate tautomerase
MPHVIVKLYPGMSENNKRSLTDDIVQAVMRASGHGPDAVSVAFQEVSAVDWPAKVYRADILGNDAVLYKEPGYKM